MGMDVKKVKFYVLDVGQGACNYVEIIDSKDKVIHNMLVDIGTNSSQAIAAKNIDWLKERIEVRDDPRIDVILLTHGDNDHYNLMMKLLPALGHPAKKSRVTMVRYGGVAWRYAIGKTSVVDELKKYCGDVTGFASFTSGWDATENAWSQLWPASYEQGDPRLYIIGANSPHKQDGTIGTRKHSKRPNAEAINSKSLVFGVYWKNKWFIGTGDATAATFSAINTHFAGIDIKTLPAGLSMTMPHHGSRKTTYDLKNANDIPGDESRRVVERFLKIFTPWTITISADERRHHHPSLLMTDQFSEVVKKGNPYWSDPELATDRHYITPWIDSYITERGVKKWPNQWIYSSVQTSANIYSTLYCDRNKRVSYACPPIPAKTITVKKGAAAASSKPPRGRNWEMSYAGGDLVMDSTPNTASVSTRREIFRGAPAHLPPTRNAAARRLGPTTPTIVRTARAAPPMRLSGLKAVT